MIRLVNVGLLLVFVSSSIFLGGVIPFAMIFVDLNELLKSSWHGELYISIPHMVLACLVMAITTSQVSVILIFFQLCSEVSIIRNDTSPRQH